MTRSLSSLFRMIARFSPLWMLLAVATVLAGCQTEAPKQTKTHRMVHAQTVRTTQETSVRSFSGTLRAPLETTLSFRVPGQVARVFVDAGERVQAGDPIARLDAEDYRLEVEAARASYRQARAAADNARAEMKRIRSLYADDNASLSAYDRARTAYETSKNQAEAAQRRLDLAQKRLGYTRLTAPATGSVGATHVESGENVQAGQPVAHLTSGDRLEVRVQVPEGLVSDLQVGTDVTVRVPARPQQDARDATVTEVASSPDGRRPTYPVVVTLDRAAESLRSGMSAQVSFDAGADQGLLVPSDAVTRDEDGGFVYVVEAAGDTDDAARVIRRRAVEPGRLTARGMIVRGALQAGERVVAAGIGVVSPGDTVRVSRLLSDRSGR
jgi:RND family efflux transporter MFP subunit